MQKQKKFSPKVIFITGGAGFIGAHYINFLKASPFTIINFDKLTYASNLNALQEFANPSHYHFIQGDICDANLVAQVLSDFNVDTIVHFAAESHVDRSITDPKAFIEANVLGTYTLLETAKKLWQKNWALNPEHCRFHHVSTDEVYGALKKDEAAFTENSLYRPNSPYSASKASSDHLVRAYFKTYNLPMTISHCSNNFGPFQHAEKFIPTVIAACLKQKSIPLYGDGSQIRDWLYVEDHCSAIQTILETSVVGKTYNIGGDNELSNKSLALLIAEKMDALFPEKAAHADLISYVTDRPGHDWRYAINSERLQQELGWRPSPNFSKNLDETIAHYLSILTETDIAQTTTN